eukprot:358216-Chlamydomonas_euryale.AAC.1
MRQVGSRRTTRTGCCWRARRWTRWVEGGGGGGAGQGGSREGASCGKVYGVGWGGVGLRDRGRGRPPSTGYRVVRGMGKAVKGCGARWVV